MLENQIISLSQKFGGSRTVLTGALHSAVSGGFDIDKSLFPDAEYGIIPAGTPGKCDELDRTAEIHYAFEVFEAALATDTTIKIAKGYEGSRIQKGMALMLAPTTATATGKAVEVEEIDRSNAGYDEITIEALGVALPAGSILIEADGAGTAAKIKVLPNGITMFDYMKHPGAIQIYCDFMFNMPDGVILTRRIPPIAPCIKAYMADANGGNCFFRYSTSK